MQHILLTFIFALALFATLFSSDYFAKEPFKESLSDTSKITIYGLHHLRYNDAGQLQDRLQAPQAIATNGSLDEISLMSPTLEMISTQNPHHIQWRVSAQKAKLYDLNLLKLQEKIDLKNLSKDSLIHKAQTDFLVIDLSKGVFSNNVKTYLLGQEFKSYGIGVEGSFVTHFLKLLSESHAIYYSQ